MVDSVIRIVADTRRAVVAIENLDSKLNKLGLTTAKLNTGVGALVRGGGGLALAIAAVGTAVGGAIVGIAALSEKARVLDAQLGLVAKSAEEVAAAKNLLREFSGESGVAFDELSKLFGRIALSKEALGATNGQILKFTDAIAKIGSLGATSKQGLNAALLQLGQGLSSGVVRAEEFNSLVENTPLLVKQIEIGLGAVPGSLKRMASEGKLFSRDVFAAILKQASEIDKAFEGIGPRLSVGIVKVKTELDALGEAVGKAFDTSPIVDDFLITTAELIRWVTDRIPMIAGAFADTYDKVIAFTQTTAVGVYRFFEGAAKLTGNVLVSAFELSKNVILSIFTETFAFITEKLARFYQTLSNLANKVGLTDIANEYAAFKNTLDSLSARSGDVVNFGDVWEDQKIIFENALTGVISSYVAFSKDAMENESALGARLDENNEIFEQRLAFLKAVKGEMERLREEGEKPPAPGSGIKQLTDAEMRKLKDQLDEIRIEASGLDEQRLEALRKEFQERIGIVRDALDQKIIDETEADTIIFNLQKQHVQELAEERLKIEDDIEKRKEEAFERELERMGGFKEAYLTAIDIVDAKMNTLGEQSFAKVGELLGNATNDFADAIGEAAVSSSSIKDATQEIAKSIGKDAVASLVKFGVQRAMLWAQGKAQQTANTVASVAQAKVVAAAWAPAAAAASLASFGTNAPPAIAGMESAYGASFASAVAGFRASGGEVGAGVYRVNEGGPEVYTGRDGRQFLLSPREGGRVDPLADAGGGSANARVVIHNNAPNTDIEVTRNDEEIIEIAVQRAVTAARRDFRASMSTGYGDYSSAINRNLAVRRRF